MADTTLLSRLAAALRECSDDLEDEIDARYASAQFRDEQVTRAHYMATVKRARALLAEWEAKKQRWRQEPP